jgi:hypothetical protein
MPTMFPLLRQVCLAVLDVLISFKVSQVFVIPASASWDLQLFLVCWRSCGSSDSSHKSFSNFRQNVEQIWVNARWLWLAVKRRSMCGFPIGQVECTHPVHVGRWGSRLCHKTRPSRGIATENGRRKLSGRTRHTRSNREAEARTTQRGERPQCKNRKRDRAIDWLVCWYKANGRSFDHNLINDSVVISHEDVAMQ